MIYGIVPVGGLGTRLNLLFPKELFPLKGYNIYSPVCKYTVDNLLEVGCDKIYFIHGKNFKKEIIDLFKGDNFYHLNNLSNRQVEIFSVFYNNISTDKDDIYLYGLPDSYYEENLFKSLISSKGLSCGLFEVSDDSNVGRLNLENNKEFIKSIKKDNLSKYCWGILKFDFSSLKDFIKIIENTSYEAEDILNNFDFNIFYGKKYWDLGTWESINKYWNNK